MRRKLAILDVQPVQYFAPLYRYLSADPDIDLTVYYCSNSGAEEYYDPGFGRRLKWDIPLLEGYRYRVLDALPWTPKAGFARHINPSIISELIRRRYDAIWIHGYMCVTQVLALVIAKMCGTAVLMREDTHLRLDRSKLRAAIRRPLMTAFYATCDGCLAIGTGSGEYFRYHRVPDSRIHLVPYAVDNERIMAAVESHRAAARAQRRALGIADDQAVILFASKLTANKRPLDLLVAYRELRERGKRAALVFVGSGEEERTLREYANRHRIDDVHFLGFKNQQELPLFYAAADIAVLSSRNERWGLVLNEFMCASLPLLVSDRIGANPDLVRHGENGLIYKCGDLGEMTSQLDMLVSSPALRQRMGECSKKLIEKWSYGECLAGIRAALAAVTR